MTSKEKAIIRSNWPGMILRFRKDGTVEASKGGAYGILYSAEQAKAHIQTYTAKHTKQVLLNAVNDWENGVRYPDCCSGIGFHAHDCQVRK